MMLPIADKHPCHHVENLLQLKYINLIRRASIENTASKIPPSGHDFEKSFNRECTKCRQFNPSFATMIVVFVKFFLHYNFFHNKLAFAELSRASCIKLFLFCNETISYEVVTKFYIIPLALRAITMLSTNLNILMLLKISELGV